MINIYIRSGDDYLDGRRLVVTATDNGAAIDLTGVDLTFEVKRTTRGDAIITKTVGAGIEIAVPQVATTMGVAYIELEAADTEDLAGRFLWELQAQDAVGIVTLGSGSLYVKTDLIHA